MLQLYENALMKLKDPAERAAEAERAAARDAAAAMLQAAAPMPMPVDLRLEPVAPAGAEKAT
jgi:hypothetical protein